MYKVVIADDRPSARQGLHTLLEGSGEYSVVGQASDGAEAIARSEELRPDLVISDLKMPGLSIIEAARLLKSRQPHLKLIILTAFDDCEDIYRAVGAGVDGYLMKDTDPEQILDAIGQVMRGSTFFQSETNEGGGRDTIEAP